ncbi:MAG: hypothetical protein WD960_14095 [Gemmatimonadota bacterium]
MATHASAPPLHAHYGALRLWGLALLAVAAGVIIAGFWNFHLVDGFGRDVVAGRTIGDTRALAGSFAERGLGFGFLFAAVAGVAATFTACNCVVFAMLPGLACSPGEQRGRAESPWWALGIFVTGVVLVSAAYGAYIGGLGPDGVAALNARGARLAQAQMVFTAIGAVMLLWGVAEAGLLDRIARRLPSGARGALGSAAVKAGALGVLVGLFAVGRPFPVFREFLSYAASAENPLYGAAVMITQGLGQIVVMIALFALIVWLWAPRLQAWALSRPHQPRLLGAFALLAGGAFFVFYWGLAFAFDIGRWGFKLGWYG